MRIGDLRLLLCVVVLMAGSGRMAAQSEASPAVQKNVLVLYGERLDLPAIRLLETAMRETFAESTLPQVEYLAEYYDFARFPEPKHEAALASYLRERYGDRKIDLVVPVSTLSLRFLMRHRADLFPDIPMVYVVHSPGARDVNSANVTGVTAKVDVEGTINLILRMQPEVREIVCVGGVNEADKIALASTRKALEVYVNRINARQIVFRTISQAIDEVREVPKESAILLASGIRADEKGRLLSMPEVARRLVPVSKAPVYAMAETLVGSGIVGGECTSYTETGRQAAGLALKVLAGKFVPPGSPDTEGVAKLVVDWRAVKHWNLPLSRVPPEATVMFRKATIWEEHRKFIIGVVAALLLQSILITALIGQRVRGRRLEREASELRLELAHAGRVTMLGTLASSLAHELNQPLGAILRNAEAAELFLQNEQPDLAELRAIVSDIRKDDQRAGDVIDRLRALLKRREIEMRPLSLEELVDEVAMLTRADSTNRHVAIVLDLPRDLPLIRGDRIHLQQVLLNLLINGMDALAITAAEDRSLTLRAQREGLGFVAVAVTDNGPGIPEEQLSRLFEPFFTTKPQGMGLGLPISRTIIQAHGGRLWAENNTGGGATFRFTLPIADGGNHEPNSVSC